MLKAYKYRLYPNKAQKELIDKTFGCCRFVYNFARGQQKKEEDMWSKVKDMQQQGYPFHDYNSRFFNKFENVNAIKELKKNYAWLSEVDSIALQSSIENLANAYDKYYKKQGGKPIFKSKKKNDVTSYTTKCVNNNIRIIGNYIKLPKLNVIKVKAHISFSGKLKKATISKTPTNKYYVSLIVDTNDIVPLEKTNKNVGIDLGITDFAILSNGIKVPNNHFMERQLRKLEKAQQVLSRKTIGSSNFAKAKLKVAEIYEKISNQRKDFLNKITYNLVKQFDVICIENLDVSALKETDNSKRNMHVSDVSWYEFKRQLAYKCEWYGKILSVVDRYFPSSQICSCCGHNDGKKALNVRSWVCPNCKTKLDRDVNASINILTEGLRILK